MLTIAEIKQYFKSESKYLDWYFNIIEKSINRDKTRLSYFEKHHILPESLFPEFKPLSRFEWNRANLTAREHFIVHGLLYKHYKSVKMKFEENKMFHAFRAMSLLKPNEKSERYVNGVIYEQLKKEFSTRQSELMKTNNSFKGKKHSEMSKLKATKSRKETMSGEKGERFRNQQSKMMKEYNPMHRLTEEQKRARSKKISNSLKGRDMGKGTENPNAKHIIIYNSNGEMEYEFHGTFLKFLKDNKSTLPTNAFYESLNQNKIMFQTKRSQTIAKTKGYKKFIGWYVLEV